MVSNFRKGKLFLLCYVLACSFEYFDNSISMKPTQKMKYSGYLLMLFTALLIGLEIYMGLHLNEALLMLGLFFLSFSITRVQYIPDLLFKENMYFRLSAILLLSAYTLMFIEGFPQHRVNQYPEFYVHIFMDLLYFATILSPLKTSNYFLKAMSYLYLLSQVILMIFELKSLIMFVSSNHRFFDVAFKVSYVLLWDILRIAILIICLKFIHSRKKRLG